MPGSRLFVYGTLMNEERLHALTGRRFPRRPARLEGYARIAPPGGYAYVIASPDAHVDGLLIEDVDPASLGALDRYEDEGRLYVRRPVEVHVEGRRVACQTYVGTTSRGAPGRARTPDRTSGA
jgi:gamma-glutamylcyclotransferase (GGCT)/AIG2-like uncharacterized protein YtfP